LFPESGVGRLARRICVVARDHPLLFGYLNTLLRDRPAGAEQIDLVIDRRHGPAPKAPEVERRRPSGVDDQLRQRGFAFVTEPGETFRPRDAARIEHTVELLAGMEDRSWPFRRRRPRPILERVWGQRPWRALAVLGAIALISTMLAAEFRMNDLIDMDSGTPSRSRETRAANEAPPAPRPETAAGSTTATATTTPAPSRLPAVSSADRHRVPGPAFSPPPEQATLAAALPPPAAETPRVQTPPPAAETPRVQTPPPAAETPRVQTPPPAAETPRVQTPPPPAETPRVQTPPRAAETPRVQTPPPSLPTRTASTRPAPKPALPTGAPALAAVAAPAALPVPAASDLRIELSRRPTSATGGGVIYMVRVTDLSGQPLPDAKVWMQAGHRASGSLFETRLSPAEIPGTYRSGVVHPSTLPPDLTVRAIVGNRRVEAPVER
jgi:hypothetical protein